MKKITILSILVLVASWWVVGQASSEDPVDGCNYEEVCKDWCENYNRHTVACDEEPPVDDCNYEEVCKDWCEDPVDDEGLNEEEEDEAAEELCISTDYIIFDLDIGLLKIIGYLDLQLD